MNVALITGITGQDGSYLSEFLVDKNYVVYGLIRRSSSINTGRIEHILNNSNLKLIYGDMTDCSCINEILDNIKNENPNMTKFEIYNLAAQSHVKVSFSMPQYTATTNSLGSLYLLDAIRVNKLENITRFYQASTSELYGLVQEIPQNENTPFYPRSPYGVSKLYSYWIVKNYREAYNMFACNGILFNHESERRGHNFVSRKITLGLNKILSNQSDRLVMGNIDAKRDWGHAKDYIEGMWLILQQDEPNDFVLATGEMHTVRQFIEKAFLLKGFNIKWKGEGLDEIGYDEKTKRELIFIDQKYYRPSEVELLLGDASKAKKILNWSPKISFDELVKLMVESDCANI